MARLTRSFTPLVLAAASCRPSGEFADREAVGSLGTATGGESTSSASDSDTGDDIPVPPFGLVARANPANVLAYFVTWSTATPASTRLVVDCGDEYQRTFAGAANREQHSVLVLGLLAETRCRATAWDDAGAWPVSSGVEFTVAPIPDFLPTMTVTASDLDAIQPGWTLTNVSKQIDDLPPPGIALYDEQGRYRWYHRRTASGIGTDSDLRVIEGGILDGGSGLSRAAIFDWSGSRLWLADFQTDHHFEPWGGDDRYLFLSSSEQGCPKDVLGGMLTWYDRSRAQPLSQWAVCEHFVPKVYLRDFAHANGVDAFADDQALLLSLRNQNQLFKIAIDSARDGTPQLGDVEWRLGYDGDFALLNDEWFMFQHAPEIQPNGNILLFDNGRSEFGLEICQALETCPANAEPRWWSRAVELAIDEQAKTAEVVWQFRPEPHILSEIWGDADRLPNGNTLIALGQREAGKVSTLIEVSPDSREVWRMESPLGWSWYRAERVVEPVYGLIDVDQG